MLLSWHPFLSHHLPCNQVLHPVLWSFAAAETPAPRCLTSQWPWPRLPATSLHQSHARPRCCPYLGDEPVWCNGLAKLNPGGWGPGVGGNKWNWWSFGCLCFFGPGKYGIKYCTITFNATPTNRTKILHTYHIFGSTTPGATLFTVTPVLCLGAFVIPRRRRTHCTWLKVLLATMATSKHFQIITPHHESVIYN